jgi:hypothetical protein
VEAEKINQMLKQVQHDVAVQVWSFGHPELVSGSRFWIRIYVLKPRPVGGILYFITVTNQALTRPFHQCRDDVSS